MYYHRIVGWESLSSDSRLGKVHSRAIRKLVGNAFDSRQTVGRERYVGLEKAFPSGLSPTDKVGRQQFFPTDCLLEEVVFPTNLGVGDVVLWCSVPWSSPSLSFCVSLIPFISRFP